MGVCRRRWDPDLRAFAGTSASKRTRKPAIKWTDLQAGYLAVWTFAGIAADLAYVATRTAGSRLHAGVGIVPVIGGAIVILAGLYQLSPFKQICLAQCSPPLRTSWYESRQIGLRLGTAHGGYSMGCCWGIMAVLFVVGLMNLAWMAALSVLLVAEKVAPQRAAIGRLLGVSFIALGAIMALQPRLLPAAGLRPSDAAYMSRMTSTQPPAVGGQGSYGAASTTEPVVPHSVWI